MKIEGRTRKLGSAGKVDFDAPTPKKKNNQIERTRPSTQLPTRSCSLSLCLCLPLTPSRSLCNLSISL